MNGSANGGFRPATPNSKYAPLIQQLYFYFVVEDTSLTSCAVLEVNILPQSLNRLSPKTKPPKPLSSPLRSPNSNNSPWPSATRSETRVRLQNK
jgi:hypothetical protein